MCCRYSGYLLLRIMYGVRTAEAMMATPHINQIRMAEFFANIISEHAGILCASAILSFGRVSGTRAPGCLARQRASLCCIQIAAGVPDFLCNHAFCHLKQQEQQQQRPASFCYQLLTGPSDPCKAVSCLLAAKIKPRRLTL